jgi:dethiobiotin synthetase
MQFLVRSGFAPAYVKPFQTGCTGTDDETSDAGFIRAHLPVGSYPGPECVTLTCLTAPKAPYFAARNEGKQIDLEEINRQLKIILERSWTHLIIEGAGGILLPVTADRLLIDVVGSLEIETDIILVARAGLGTINHTLLSLEALDRRDLRPRAIVLIDNDPPETPQDMIEENMEAIETFSGIRPAGVIVKIQDFTAPDNVAYEVITRIFMPTPD